MSDGQRIIIPVWMTDPIFCSGFLSGPPLCSLDALAELRQFINDQLMNLTNPATQEDDHENSSHFDSTPPLPKNLRTSTIQGQTSASSHRSSPSSIQQNQAHKGGK